MNSSCHMLSVSMQSLPLYVSRILFILETEILYLLMISNFLLFPEILETYHSTLLFSDTDYSYEGIFTYSFHAKSKRFSVFYLCSIAQFGLVFIGCIWLLADILDS